MDTSTPERFAEIIYGGDPADLSDARLFVSVMELRPREGDDRPGLICIENGFIRGDGERLADIVQWLHDNGFKADATEATITAVNGFGIVVRMPVTKL